MDKCPLHCCHEYYPSSKGTVDMVESGNTLFYCVIEDLNMLQTSECNNGLINISSQFSTHSKVMVPGSIFRVLLMNNVLNIYVDSHNKIARLLT